MPLSRVERRPYGRLVAEPRVAPRVPLRRCALLAEPLSVARATSSRVPSSGRRARARRRRRRSCAACRAARARASVGAGGGRFGRRGRARRRAALAAPLERRALAQRPPLVPGGLDQQPAGVRVAGLGDRAEPAPLAASSPRSASGRETARATAAGSASSRRARPSARARSASTTPRRQQSRPTISANGGSAASSAIAWSSASRRAFACTPPHTTPRSASCSGRLSKRCRRSQASWASVHAARVVDQPVPQQQLREPMPRPHQLATRVLARPHQIAGRLLVRLRHPHRDQLAEPQQPRQPLRVATVGLDPVRRRPRDLRRRRHRARDPGRRARTREPVPGRAGLIGDPHRRRRTAAATRPSPPAASAPADSAAHPLAASSTPATTLRACTSNPTHVPSAIPAPPVIAALPPRHSRRQPAPTYERGAGSLH